MAMVDVDDSSLPTGGLTTQVALRYDDSTINIVVVIIIIIIVININYCHLKIDLPHDKIMQFSP